MKKLLAVLAAIGVLMGPSSCSLFIPDLSGAAGRLLSVDKDKHFTKDVEYHQGTGVYKYFADGRFEEEYYETYSTTIPATEQTGGNRGTYTYDPETMLLTRIVTSWYSGTSWTPYDSTVSDVRERNAYFAEHAWGSVYMRSGSEWVMRSQYTFEDTADPSYDYTDTYTYRYSLAAGANGFSFDNEAVELPGSGSSFTFYKEHMEGDAEFFPAGATLSKGKSVSVRVTLTSSTYQDYNWPSGPLNPSVSDYLGIIVLNFTCMGDYLIFYPSTASRSLGAAESRR